MASSEGHDVTQVLTRAPRLRERYQFLQTLGEGSAGLVCLVKDAEADGALRAMKLLRSKGAFDEHTVARFFEELRICQRIQHPNLIHAFDFIQEPGVIGFTMEYVDGGNLLEIIRQTKLDEKQIDSIFTQVLAGLAELHRNSIVHRDVKLENILVGKDGVVRLTDLGLVRRMDQSGLTKTGILLGTAAYLPPEYITKSHFDERGDIYSVGLMLYEVLTRKRFLDGVTQGNILEYRMKTKFRLPSFQAIHGSRKHLHIVEKATRVDPRERYASANEMAEAFHRENPVVEEPAHSRASERLMAIQDFGGDFDRRQHAMGRLMLAAAFILTVLLVFSLAQHFVDAQARERLDFPENSAGG